MTKTKSIYLTLLAVLLSPMAANADLITWELSGVFDDAATLSGEFTVDTDTSSVTDWSISTSAGVLSAFTFDTASSFFFAFDFFGNPNSFVIATNEVGGVIERYINLSFTSSFFAAGSIASDVSGFFAGTWECDNCATVRYLESGGATSVPEPGTLALLGIGLLGMGAARRRKKA